MKLKNSSAKTMVFDTSRLAPFCDGARFSIERERSAGAAIIRLFGSRGPSAIFRAIGSIVVDALDRVLRRRALSHVGVERREVVAPSVTNADASSSVARKGFVGGIKAAGFHGIPYDVLSTLRQGVLRGADAMPPLAETSATFYAAMKQAEFWCSGVIPAFAQAPQRLLFSDQAVDRHDGKHSEFAAKHQRGVNLHGCILTLFVPLEES